MVTDPAFLEWAYASLPVLWYPGPHGPERRAPPLPLAIHVAGFGEGFVRTVQRVRDAVETRIATAILGTEVASTWQASAFKAVRTGALGNIRLLHLLNEKDASTTQDPLGGFTEYSKGGASALCSKLRQAQTTLQRALLHANIMVGCAAIEFFHALFDCICDGVSLGVKLADASEFWRATVAKAQRSMVANRFGLSDARGATYDVAFVKQHSDARVKFDRAVSSAHALAQLPPTPAVAPGAPAIDKRKSKAEKLRLEAEAKKAKIAKSKDEPKGGAVVTRKEAIAAFNVGKGTHADGVDATAQEVLMPGALGQFATDCPPCDVGHGHKSRQCFNYCHPQGCALGDACPFAHKKN